MELVFLTIEDILYIHQAALSRYGGERGLRDPAMLDSAVQAPQASFGGEYLYKSPAAMAARYWHSLCLNHAFIDGNKRASLVAADAFLALNGLDLNMSEELAERLTIQIATREIEFEDLVQEIKAAVRDIE